jgi:hypothetical protein
MPCSRGHLVGDARKRRKGGNPQAFVLHDHPGLERLATRMLTIVAL